LPPTRGDVLRYALLGGGPGASLASFVAPAGARGAACRFAPASVPREWQDEERTTPPGVPSCRSRPR